MGACSSPEGPPAAPAGDNAAAKVDVSGISSQLRILIAPSGTHYRMENGAAHGATVDLAADFEKWLNAQTAPGTFHVTLIEWPEDQLIAGLLAGKGDIAANLLLTFERDDQVAFAKPVRTGIKEIVVTAPGQPPLVSLEDVGGRDIHVRKSSDHYASLVRLNDQLKKINRPPAQIVLLPAGMTDEAALDAMNNGASIPATIVDDYVYDARRAALSKLNANRDVAVSQDGSLSWVTRKDTPRLLEVLNAFFSTHRLTS